MAQGKASMKELGDHDLEEHVCNEADLCAFQDSNSATPEKCIVYMDSVYNWLDNSREIARLSKLSKEVPWPCYKIVPPPYTALTGSGTFELPALQYANDGLEPFMDAATVEVHHTGHHKAYTNKLNAALADWRAAADVPKELASKSILEIIRNLKDVPPKFLKAIRNNGGGYVNHDIFFACMSSSKTRGGEPKGALAKEIDAKFGSFAKFKEAFNAAAAGVFGSGYAWLSRDAKNELQLTTSANQESAITEGLKPILVIDVWEHAYYLKYKNKRPDFIAQWWNLVDWDNVDALDKWWAGK